MPIRPLLLALCLPLAAASCKKIDLGASPKLAADAAVSGEITATSPVNYNNGSHNLTYKLNLKKDQVVALELSGALRGELAVFAGNAMLASAARMGGAEGDARADANVGLAFRAPQDGDYLVAVNGADAKAFGPFKLASSLVTPYQGKALPLGEEVTDWLLQEQQPYTLKVAKTGMYTIEMRSQVLDPYLRLNGKGVELEDDDGGNNLDARIRTYLEPGEYTVQASAANGGTGAFKLRVSSAVVDAATVMRDGTTLALDQYVAGVVDARGRRSFVLQVEQPVRLQLDARSDELDTTLTVTGPGVSAEDDDGGDGSNSRLTLDLVPGRYTVVVGSLGQRQGSFELLATQLGGANAKRKSVDVAAAEAAAAAAAAAAEAAE